MLNTLKRMVMFVLTFAAVGAIFFAYSAVATSASHIDENNSTELVVNK